MKSLKLPGYAHINPIFISICGLSGAWIKILYMFLQSKKAKVVPIAQTHLNSPDIEIKSVIKNDMLGRTESTSSFVGGSFNELDDRKMSGFYKKPKNKRF